MTASLISLLSIFVGIVASNLAGIVNQKHSFGLVGNTIAGVFGSIFLIKTFGRLGFDPSAIVTSEGTNWSLFAINIAVSGIGGYYSLVLIKEIKKIMETENYKFDSIRIFRVVSFLEGASYILLLFLAVPIKYIYDNSAFVKALGMPHGILFVLYIILALFIRNKMKWNAKSTVIVLGASLLPFGTFYINRKYL